PLLYDWQGRVGFRVTTIRSDRFKQTVGMILSVKKCWHVKTRLPGQDPQQALALVCIMRSEFLNKRGNKNFTFAHERHIKERSNRFGSFFYVVYSGYVTWVALVTLA